MTVTGVTTADALAEWLVAARKTSKSLDAFSELGEPLPEDEQELRSFFRKRIPPGSYVEVSAGASLRGWSWKVTISSWGKDQDDRLVIIDLPGIPRALENLIKVSHGHSINGWE